MIATEAHASLRIDKWLWAARFYKTRSLATAAIHAGHVKLNGTTVKPARELHPGDTLELAIGDVPWTIEVLGVNDHDAVGVGQRFVNEAAVNDPARQGHAV